MPLTDQQKDATREEEAVRADVQKEIAESKRPVSKIQKLNAFLESKVGFWLLATVLTGIVTTAYGSLQLYLNKDQVARQKEAEDTRRDTDIVIRIAPMLSSTDMSQVRVGSILLSSLAEHKAMNQTLALQVRFLFDDMLRTGQKPDATPDEIQRTDVLSQAFDSASRVSRANGADSSDPAASTPVVSTPTMLDNAALPVRLYIQIPSDTQRNTASGDRDRLRAARLIVPGIETVGLQRSPKQTEVRYCKDKVSDPALQQVTDAAAKLATPVTRIISLDPSLCTNVRYNHFELWYARGA
jgi:hypothetical protein